MKIEKKHEDWIRENLFKGVSDEQWALVRGIIYSDDIEKAVLMQYALSQGEENGDEEHDKKLHEATELFKALRKSHDNFEEFDKLFKDNPFSEADKMLKDMDEMEELFADDEEDEDEEEGLFDDDEEKEEEIEDVEIDESLFHMGTKKGKGQK